MFTKKLASVLGMFGLIAFFVCAAPCKGDFASPLLGGTVEGDSWFQAFDLHTDRPFTDVGLVLDPWPAESVSGFESDAWDFSIGGSGNFAQVLVHGGPFDTMWTIASGDATTDLAWRSHFLGNDPERQNFLLTLFTWDHALNWEFATAHWTGNTWDFGFHTAGISWEQIDSSGSAAVVPVPSAAVLGLLGLGLVTGIYRRLR